MSFFRRTKDLSVSTEMLNAPTATEVKKARFSLLRIGGRRSGVVIAREPSLLRKVKRPPTPTTPSSSSSGPSASSSSSSEESSDSTAVSDGSDVAEARNRALNMLEGRTSQPNPDPVLIAAPPASATLSGEDAGHSESNRESTETITLPGVTAPVLSSFFGALSGRSRRGSVSSRQSVSPEGPRASWRLSLVPENRVLTTPTPLVSEEAAVDELGLPTYDSAAYPSRAATYRFAQTGPFAMTVAGDEEEMPGFGRFHVSVGVNVWAPKSSVTVVRRGLDEDGAMVAQIEWGSSSVSSTLTIGNMGRPLKDVISKNLVNASKMYHVGDGSILQWKMSRTYWKAYVDSTHLATFIPLPPRKLVVLPVGHRLLDHLLIAVLVLTREKEDALYSRPTSEYGMVAVMPYM